MKSHKKVIVKNSAILNLIWDDVFINNGAFTLIELLVVVLIIGILAAVAVPQYQKAVLKSRLTEVMVSTAALQKALDLYVLSNGLPDEQVRFWGEDAKGSLDVNLECTGGVFGDACVTNLGTWSVACHSLGCFMDMTINEKIGNGHIAMTTRETGVWNLYRVPTDTSARKVVCQWWVENYGINRFYIREVYGDPAELCAEVGVQ